MKDLAAGYPWRIRDLLKELPNEKLEALKLYQVELLRFNQKLNLISPGTEMNADIVHFYDSVRAAKFIEENLDKEEPLFDLGSGNGFPGIICALLQKNRQVISVDSDARKCEFMKFISARLELRSMEVQNKRIEDVQFRKATAVCRGLASLARTLLMTRTIMDKDSQIFSMKGANWFSEVASLPHQICSTWNTEMAYEYILPQGLGDRVIIKSTKLV